ncbi:uncharacterized protein [Periplaneta americana]|uniref:uncharacterized protein n=1 Tax=Periplaneta americana TaxID=6978 RepID=UPI0037E81455
MPKFVTVGADGRVILYDEEKKCQERVYKSSGNAEVCDGHTSRVYAACFHPDNPYEFMTGGWDDTVLYWDIRQPAPSRHLSGIHICGEGLDISATGREVLTCAWQRDNQMKLWDYNSGRLIRDLHPDVENSKLYCGKWLTKDLIIAGGSELNLIRVADVYKDITIAMIQGLPKGVYSLDKGPMEPRRSQVKKVNIKYSTEPKELPKVAFCAGKRIYEFIFK